MASRGVRGVSTLCIAHCALRIVHCALHLCVGAAAHQIAPSVPASEPLSGETACRGDAGPEDEGGVRRDTPGRRAEKGEKGEEG